MRNRKKNTTEKLKTLNKKMKKNYVNVSKEANFRSKGQRSRSGRNENVKIPFFRLHLRQKWSIYVKPRPE